MNTVKGIIFDYGGTIDTNGIHWAEVIWEQYRHTRADISKELFREAYVYGERTLARHRIIEENDTFHTLLKKKTAIQAEYLRNNSTLVTLTSAEQTTIVEGCYRKVLETLKITRNRVEHLAMHYPLVLVTNFYGNMPVVLKEFNLEQYFSTIVESSTVGLRKPDPALYALGVKALNISPDETLVIGDSYKKDILPAKSLGCKAIWLKGICWEEEIPLSHALPDRIIKSLEEIESILNLPQDSI